jgi:hypothetical protein
MAKQTEQEERERLAYLGSKHPGDLTVEEQAEFEELREKYG